MNYSLERGAALMLAACLTAACGSSATGAAAGPNAETGERSIPADLRAAVERSQGIGRLLYELDQIAATGTDRLMADVPDPKASGVRGYLPMQEAGDDGKPLDSYLVSFFTGDDPPRIAFDVRVPRSGRPTLQAFNPPRESSHSFTAMVRARQAALRALPAPTQPINPVLVPGSVRGEDGVLVYLLAGTNTQNVAVFGLHHRALVDLGTSTVKSMTPLSKGILEVATVGPDGPPESLVVSTLVADYPLETHVFTSLLTRLPVYVTSRRGLWRVDGDKIAYAGELPPPPPY